VKCLSIFFLVFYFSAVGQQDKATVSSDSLEKVREHNRHIYSAPRRASIMSGLLPGLGQVYNRKYWKVPVIYAGLGAFGYMFKVNNDNYWFYRRNLIAEYDGDPETVNATFYSGEQLQSQKLYYRRFRDFAAIGIGLLYILNIIDANVDAHLRTFDVSDDLSFSVTPLFGFPAAKTTGIMLKLQF
jgi:hypothetical protein